MGQRTSNILPILPVAGLTANLPAPSDAALMFAQVTDVPGVGTGLMWSDGSQWRSIPFSAQKVRIQTASDGTLTWTYPVAFPSSYIPRISVVAEATAGTTDVVNVQIDGTPTNTQAKFRVTRTQQSVVALLGLTILSVPASVGATWLHIEVFG